MAGRLSAGLLLLLLVSAAYAEERDMILVLDNSRIMEGIDARGLAGPAVSQFIEKLKGDVRAAIILFDHSATVSVPLTAVTDESRLEFLEALQKLNYRCQYSDVAIALEQAIRELEVNGRGGAEKSIILLTGGLLDPSDTALVQSRLRALGYEVGPIDGIRGPKTRGAIRQFQRQVGMPADGKLNKTLLIHLEKAYEARWQGELAANAARAGIKVIAVVVGEGFALGQALAEKTSGEYLQIPKAEDLAGVFERLSNAFSQEVEVPAPALEVPAIQVPERVETLPAQPAEVALPEEHPKVAEEVHTFFLFLMIMLLTARLFAEVAARLQSPPVIGELLAGIVLGPSLLGWINPTEVIKLLAEIGIILLLFEVGLETDVRQLARTGTQSLIVATGGFALPFLLGYGLSRWVLELDILPSLFVGGTLTATSIGITVRVLSDLKRQASHEGQVVLGAAVLDDVLGVVLLALLYEFAVGGGISLANTAQVLFFITLFFALATPAAKLLSLIIYRFDSVSEIPGLLPTTIVALVLFFAWLAHTVGAPSLLGGFAAGLALSRWFSLPFGLAILTDADFAHRVEGQMKPIIHLFTPIFFVMVGLSLNLREIDWESPFIWLFSLSLVIIAVIGKVAGAMLIRDSWHARLAIGMAMVPRGEVGLIFAELGRVSGIFDNEIYAGMVIVIALTTLLPPFAMKWFYGQYGHWLPVEATKA
jgi:Kef-type K+ transport system membrane component KefB